MMEKLVRWRLRRLLPPRPMCVYSEFNVDLLLLFYYSTFLSASVSSHCFCSTNGAHAHPALAWVRTITRIKSIVAHFALISHISGNCVHSNMKMTGCFRPPSRQPAAPLVQYLCIAHEAMKHSYTIILSSFFGRVFIFMSTPCTHNKLITNNVCLVYYDYSMSFWQMITFRISLYISL